MIEAHCLFSGSRGNCYYIKTESAEILVDAGKSARAIENELSRLGTSKKNISAIFVTHTHIDHVSALPVLLKNSDATVYCTSESAEALEERGISAEKIRIINTHSANDIEKIIVRAFETLHDCAGSVGYRFDFLNGESLAIATDIGAVTSDALAYLFGSTAVVLEANHDIEMLRRGPYPQSLKARILSSGGHLSNEGCAECLKRLVRGGTTRFLLAHVSEENNDRKIISDLAREALSGFTCSFDIARQDEAVLICKK